MNYLEEYKKENEDQLRVVKEKIGGEPKNYPVLDSYFLYQVKKEIYSLLEEKFETGGFLLEWMIELETPPLHVDFDLAFSVFKLARILKEKNPAELAQKVVSILNESPSVFRQPAEALGPFVNFRIKDDTLISAILGSVKELGSHYGESDGNSGKVALIEYSSPNIAKPIGVGHMRSTIIGQALVNLSEATGYKAVIRHSYLGDWGTQFGKLAYAYEIWGNEGMLQENALRNLKDLYVKFHEEAEKNPTLEEKGREYAARLESGDEKLLDLWARFRAMSIQGFRETFARLGVGFDAYLGESYFGASNEKDSLVEECLRRGIAHTDPETGAVVVEGLKNKDGKELSSFILRKKDGTTLYLGRDLSALKKRIQLWQPNEVFIVAGKEQELHFRQLFALANELGVLSDQVSAQHIDFGTVLSDGKKMSTRKGSLVELESLLEEAVEKATSLLKEKNPDIPESAIQENAETIGIGAIIYNDLRQSRERNISFDWNKMLNFEGASAAYLQYTAVRISSILGKVGEGDIYPAQLETVERSLLIKLGLFPKTVLQAKENNSPHLIATYLEELAQLFNSFYAAVSVKDTKDENHRKMRIQLIWSIRQVIFNGLALLNIKVPAKM